MGIMNNEKGYITEREWQEWKRNKYGPEYKDFQEYCQIKDCGKPCVQAIITHEDGEKPICDECLKKYFLDTVYDWETEKWNKVQVKRREFLLIDIFRYFADRFFIGEPYK